MNHHDGRIGELLDQIVANQNFVLFLDLLSETDSHARVLFLHKKDLLESEGELLLPALPFTGDYTHGRWGPVEQTRLLEFLVLRETDSKPLESLASVFGFEEEEQQDDLLDIIVYLAIRWARSNGAIVSLMTSPEFSFALMKEQLGNIRETIQLETQSATDEDGLGSVDTLALQKVEKLASKVGTSLSSGLSLLKSLSDVLPNLFLVIHMAAIAWHTNILDVSGVTYDDYITLLNDLYRCKLIDDRSAVMWCNNCGLDTPSYTEIHGRVAPDSLKKARCIRCGRPVSFSCVYDLDPLLSEVVHSDDGFLSIYFAWLLETQEIPFSCNLYGAKYESDFLVGDTLVECKVLRNRTAEDRTALHEEASKAANQIVAHVSDLSRQGVPLARTVLLWNLDVDTSALASHLSDRFPVLFKEYGFSVFGPSDMDSFVSELKAGKQGTKQRE